MTDNRSKSQQDLPTETDQGPDLVLALVGAHASRPPYDAVDFPALTSRIVAGAADDLARRRGGTSISRTGLRRWRPRAWWEVAADWARPAMAAALATIAVTGALVLATSGAVPGTPIADTTTTVSPAVSAGIDGVDGSLFGSLFGALTATSSAPEVAPISADSLLSAIVDGR